MRWTVTLCAVAACAGATEIAVGLNGNWTAAPARLELAEAALAHGPGPQILLTLFSDTQWLDSGDDDLDFEESEIDFEDFGEDSAGDSVWSVQKMYNKLTRSWSEPQKGLFNLDWLNRVHSPRILVHYDHYNKEIKPLEPLIRKQCAKDSFGEKIADTTAVFVRYQSRIYCSDQDLYALQLGLQSEEVFDFDRVIGNAEDAPILVLYGDPDSPRFASMLLNLLGQAQLGKLRFVWRYIPTSDSAMPLTGYGTTFVGKLDAELKKTPKAAHTLRDIAKVCLQSPLYKTPPEDLAHISAVVAHLATQDHSPEGFQAFSDILQHLPQCAPYLAKIQPPDFETTVARAKANEAKGASSYMVGLYVNGAQVNRLETDLGFVTRKLAAELALIDTMSSLGFSAEQSKLIFSKFALLSAVRENRYRTGNAFNRYKVYEDVFDAKNKRSGGVVFFNDIEADDNYNNYSGDRHHIYIGDAARLRQGQVPPLRENVHDLVFAINFSNKAQLKVFFAMAKMVLDKAIPQQVGILPVPGTPKDKKIARMFYHIMDVSEPKEALAFLYKYYETADENEEAELFARIAMPDSAPSFKNYMSTVDKYSIDEASVVINGVIHTMRSQNWQTKMGQQIVSDVRVLQNHIRLSPKSTQPLKQVLYGSAKSERNTRIHPKDPSTIRYKKITPELAKHSVAFQKDIDESLPSITMWVIGDFNSDLMVSQLLEALLFMALTSTRLSQVRLLNTARSCPWLEELVEKYGSLPLSTLDIRAVIKTLGAIKTQIEVEPSPEVISLLERHEIQSHHSTLLFNSRFFRLDRVFGSRDLEAIAKHEFVQRLDILDEILAAYPEPFNGYTIMNMLPDASHDPLVWYDLVTSTVTNSFFIEDSLVRTDVARFDFLALDFGNSFHVGEHDLKKPIDVLLVIDPVDVLSQKLVSLVPVLKMNFVNVQILIQPLSEPSAYARTDRFYHSHFISLNAVFLENGNIVSEPSSAFSLPKATYVVDLDTPNHWHYVKSQGTDEYDLDKLVVGDSPVKANFTLQGLALEAFVRNVKTGKAIAGAGLQVANGESFRQCTASETMGYCQMIVRPGSWALSPYANEQLFDLLSADANKYIANDEPQSEVVVPVFDLNQHHINVRARLTSSGAIKSSKGNDNTINVFCIARGHEYEKLLMIMMLSVQKHASQTVKFWVLENYVSEGLRQQLPSMAEKHGFQYEYVSYQWPLWLRAQDQPHREVWAYKMLFLDVLFPAEVERMIFVDADQVARADLKKLMEMDLEDHAYAFTPMCESRPGMEGYHFWKQGYWKKMLGEELKYHISALFVVDLQKFRAYRLGDVMRAHYQKLSSDPNSLANLDQDLPNNLQHLIPIFSLPQEWLWCSTWCSEELKSQAKMIDMCNDPTSAEDKISRARRQIEEWDTYNRMLADRAIEHDEL